MVRKLSSKNDDFESYIASYLKAIDGSIKDIIKGLEDITKGKIGELSEDDKKFLIEKLKNMIKAMKSFEIEYRTSDDKEKRVAYLVGKMVGKAEVTGALLSILLGVAYEPV